MNPSTTARARSSSELMWASNSGSRNRAGVWTDEDCVATVGGVSACLLRLNPNIGFSLRYLCVLCVSAVFFVLFRVISWIFFEPCEETIHESTRNNTKNTAETQRTQR